MSFPVETTDGETVQIVDKVIEDATRPYEGTVFIAEDGRRFRPPLGTNQYLIVEEITDAEGEPQAAPEAEMTATGSDIEASPAGEEEEEEPPAEPVTSSPSGSPEEPKTEEEPTG